MRAIVKHDLHLLGTDIRFKAGEQVIVLHATNQPDNADKWFIAKVDEDMGRSMLVTSNEIQLLPTIGENLIPYRGSTATVDYPARLAEDQKWKYIGTADKRYKREVWDEVYPCGDCSCVAGELHLTGCDIERCPKCGRQLIGCGCPFTNKFTSES